MKLLNTYFSLITRMEEVTKTKEFLGFLGISELYHLIPNKIGELVASVPHSEMQLTSVSVSDEVIVFSTSTFDSPLSRAKQYLSNWIGSGARIDGFGQIEIWRRLPNSHLSERAVVQSKLPRVTMTKVMKENAFFGTVDGRVGYFRWRPDFINQETCESGYLTGMVHVGAVTSLYIEDDDYVWSGGADGLIHRFDIKTCSVSLRMSSNPDDGAVSSMLISESVIYVGLTTGIINVFNLSPDSLTRLVTILQGPFCPIVSLFLSKNLLVATHSGGMMDSTEGSNTLQFWEVSEILSRGTSKLPNWGPLAGSAVGAALIGSDMVAVAASNGTINVFTPSPKEVTNRAKYIFKGTAELGSIKEHCFCVHQGFIYAGASDNIIRIYKIPPFMEGELDLIDISSREVCQSIERNVKDDSDSEDLHSWAR
jgi:WD40 repeat protein